LYLSRNGISTILDRRVVVERHLRSQSFDGCSP
jgi:hypothetical protein